MIQGAGANITVLTFPEGITLVDSGAAQMTDKVLAAVRTLSPQPIRYIINTSVTADHVGGNEKLAGTGSQITGGNVSGQVGTDGAEIIAHEHVLERMIARTVKPPVPIRATPQTTYHTDQLKLSTFYHGDGIEVFHMPAAHTDGDSIVYFRHNDVIAAGDVFDTTGYPMIDLERGGSINGEVEALNQILDIAFPDFRLEGGTLVDPRTWPHLRLRGRRLLPRHGDHRARPRAGHGEEGPDARPGEGRAADAGLRPPLRVDVRGVDHRHVRRGRVQEPQRQERLESSRALIRGRGFQPRRRGPERAALLVVLLSVSMAAQRGPQSAKDGAPVDLTGYWVSIVTEDWRYRMVTPARGRSSKRPAQRSGQRPRQQLGSGEGRSRRGAVQSVRAAGVMRAPGRLHVTWQDDTTLKIETEAGTQTRLLRFGQAGPPPPDALSVQGDSAAQWEFAGGARGGRGRAQGPSTGSGQGNLKVVTTRMRPGYLQKNGVPYSGNAVLTEYFAGRSSRTATRG